MAELGNLTNAPIEVVTDNDNIVIKKYIDGYEGGRTLDTSGYALPVIKAGHIVIRETATGVCKPMPLDSENKAYTSLPSGYEYMGIVVATKLTERPFVGILTNGTVNPAAAPYPYDTVLSDLKAALPQVEFRKD